MKQNYKGFTVPNEIWYSEELSVKAKFVACCIIESITIENGIRIAGKGSIVRILNEDVMQIANSQAISTAFFFSGIAELEKFGFVSNLNTYKTDYIEFQINF